MSGIVSGINYSLLFSSPSDSTASIDASILNTLYSGSTSGSQPPTTFVSSGNPITDPTLAQHEETKGVAMEAKQPSSPPHNGVLATRMDALHSDKR
jgi:hypothetical protein